MTIMGMSWEPHRRLTMRQWEIWKLVAVPLDNQEIGDTLGWNNKVIQYEVSQLYSKLHIPDGSNKRIKLALMFPISVDYYTGESNN